MAVRQKRRIYDITNVLEGIGLIEKKTKNAIQWKYVVVAIVTVFFMRSESVIVLVALDSESFEVDFD